MFSYLIPEVTERQLNWSRNFAMMMNESNLKSPVQSYCYVISENDNR